MNDNKQQAKGFGATKILAVDDTQSIGTMISRWLASEGFGCDTATNVDDALDLLQQQQYELIISDIMMPGRNGIELLEIVKEVYPDTAVIMATAVDDRKTAVNTLQLGAFGYVIKPFDRNEFIINVVNALERRRLTIASKEYEHRLEQEVRDRTRDIRRREEEIALRLISASGYRDEETGEHIKRLGLYSAAMAEALGWEQEIIDYLRIAAPMHDVGKIGIPDEVLRKPGKLSADEFQIIKGHSEIGERILGGSSIPLLQLAASIALSHHEKWDGSGYPQGLRGEAIPAAARIVAVADVYDALSNDRVYRAAMPEEKVLQIMNEGKGSHFDPEIHACFYNILPVFREILAECKDQVSSAPQKM
ncbi:MAG: response regulator [Deltaproteobacteria bacterium]|nr:response regulator [Deltaproteobacteria bacterium]